jgi:hypothetical protein
MSQFGASLLSSDNSRGVIYDSNIFIIQAIGIVTIKYYEPIMYGKWKDFVVS